MGIKQRVPQRVPAPCRLPGPPWPAAGDARVSPRLLLPGQRVANTSYAAVQGWTSGL